MADNFDSEAVDSLREALEAIRKVLDADDGYTTPYGRLAAIYEIVEAAS